MEIKNLTKRYNAKGSGRGVLALQKVTLSLPEKGLIFIVGKSGSGKSTLLKLMGGLIAADSGKIVVEGRNICSLSNSELAGYRNSCLGFVYQDYNLIAEMSVEENIALAMNLQGSRDVKAAVAAALERVELANFEDRNVVELSGGQAQRVAIARAIVKDPRIILADEPTGALDSATGESILTLLKDLSLDKLVVVVTHEISLAEKYGDRIIELADGKVVYDSNPDDEQNHEECALVENADAQDGKNHRGEWTKPKLALSVALKIGCGNFKRHPIRLALTIIMSVISFALMGLAFSIALLDPVSGCADAIMSDADVDYFQIQKVAPNNDGSKDEILGGRDYLGLSLPLSDEDVKLLKSDFNISIQPIQFTVVLGFQPSVTDIEQNTIKFGYAATIMQMAEAKKENPNVCYATCAYGFMHITLDDCEYLGYKVYGSLPTNSDEVAINECMLNQFMIAGIYDDGVLYSITCAEDMIGRKISVGETNEDLRALKTVTGVVDSGCTVEERTENHDPNIPGPIYVQCGRYHEKIYVSEDFCDEWDIALCQRGNDKKELTRFLTFALDDKSGYFFKPGSFYADRYFYAYSRFSFYKSIMIIASALMLAFALVFLINFISTSIKDRMLQIGIMSSFGAGFRELVEIYMTRSAIVCFVVFALSVAAAGFGVLGVNNYVLKVYEFAGLVKFSAYIPLLIFGMAAVTAVAGCMIPLLRVRKMSPAVMIDKGRIQ